MKKIVSILLSLILLGSVSAYAAFPSAVKIDQVIQGAGDLCVVFHASDGAGAVIPDLTADNVALTLAGQTLPATVEPAAVSGVGYVFALDVSATLTAEQFAAVRETLKGWVSAMGPQDRSAIVTFGAQAATVAELTGDVNTLLAALDSLGPADPEAMLCSGIVRAVDVAARQGEGLPRQRVVVLVSDGHGSAADPVGMEAVRVKAAGSGVTLYAAGAVTDDNADSLAVLSDTVLATGGRMETDGKDTLSGSLERLRAYIGSGTCATAGVPPELADGTVKNLTLTVTSEGVSVSDGRDMTVGSPAAPAAPAAQIPAVPVEQTPAEQQAAPGPDDAAAEDEGADSGAIKEIIPYVASGCCGAALALLAVFAVSAVKKRKTAGEKKKEKEEKTATDQPYAGEYFRIPSVQDTDVMTAGGPSGNGPGCGTLTVGLGPDAPSGETTQLGEPVSSRLVLTDHRHRQAYSAQLTDRLTIGRAEDMNQIVIRDERIDARHCEVFRDGGRVMVRDMGTKSGTVLTAGGVRYTVDTGEGHDIRTGDELEIGGTKLEVTSL